MTQTSSINSGALTKTSIKPRPFIFDALLLLIANALWGATDVVAKFAIQEMSPPALVWARFTIALIPFVPVIYLKRNEIPRSLTGLAPFLALGLCGFFLNFVLYYYGLRLAPASHATAFRVTEALVVLILSALLLKEKVGKLALVGIILGAAGVITILDINFQSEALFAGGYRLGDLLILAGILVEGLYTVIGKRVLVKTSPLLATSLACFFGWSILTLYYGPQVFHEFRLALPSPRALLACAYLGIFATSLGYWLYYSALSRRESHKVGASIMLQPLIGIPLAALVFHEKITPGFLLGAAFILVGVYFALARKKQ